MSESFGEDLLYLAKVILFTFLMVSILAIYQQKVFEGLILLTSVCQIILIWYLVEQYNLNDVIMGSTPFSYKSRKYMYLAILTILFIIALFFIFRGIIIVQQSFDNYGQIKTSLYFDISVAILIGILILILFILFYFFGKKLFKNLPQQLSIPAMILWILFYYLI